MRRLVLGGVCALLAACGSEGSSVGPIVDRIPDAIAAIEVHYGSAQEYFEISAGLDRIRFVVAVDGATAAEQGVWVADGSLTVPEPVGEASGSTFTADRIDLDPDRIFTRLRDELDDPAIIDLAIQGGPDGSPVYDATVASDGGGVLLVLLGPEGEIRGVQEP